MSLEENKAIVRRYQDVLNANQLDELDEIVAANLRMPDILPGFEQGLEGAKQVHRVTVAAWPDFQATIEDMIAEGDQVAAVITMTGTAVHPVFGLPGSGNSFRIAGMYVVRIAEGKIAEHRGLEDAVGLMKQITGT